MLSESMWRAVAEIALAVQLDLDSEWPLERLAERAGYQQHHFARAFRVVVGEPPVNYVRRLRLERAAAVLAREQASVLEVALHSGYDSGEAFARAFRRLYGVAPSDFRDVHLAQRARSVAPRMSGLLALSRPPGLSEASLRQLPPFEGVSTPLNSFESRDLAAGVATLMHALPVTGEWQLGCMAQPWGWLGGGFRRDLRMLRFLHAPIRSGTLLPVRFPGGAYACFHFEGMLDDVHSMFEWIMHEWIPCAGLQPAFSPMVSQLRTLHTPTDGQPRMFEARLFAPLQTVHRRRS